MGSLVRIQMGERAAERVDEKEHGLLARLGELRSVIVALSKVGRIPAYPWRGRRTGRWERRRFPVTALSESYSAYDREQVEIFLKATGVRHEFVATHEMENPAYRANAADRCYYCKDELFFCAGRFWRRDAGLRLWPTA